MTAKKLRVACIGGGLGGLTLALTLGKAQQDGADVELTVYEAAPAFAEIGAGVSIGKNAVQILEQLGIGEEYAKIADFSDAQSGPAHDLYFDWRRWDNAQSFGKTMQTHHSYVHRARFLDCMLASVPQCVKRQFNKRLVDFTTENGVVTLNFVDGTTAEADCVIGCDGIKSAIRAKLHPPKDGAGAIRYSGSYCYRGLIDAKVLSEKGYKHTDVARMYLGPQKHILAFPVDHNKTVNVVAFVSDRSQPYDERKWEGHPKVKQQEDPAPWVTPIDKKLMLDDFADWNEEAQILLQQIEKPSCWALHELTDLNNWVYDRIALMGDAASATTPHQGSGAGQAIESGYIIGKLLAEKGCTADTVAEYLQVYQDVRKERHDRVKNTSRDNGELFELCGKGTISGLEGKPLAWDQSEQGYKDLAAELGERHSWIFNYDIEDTWRKAQEQLKQRGL